MKSTLEVRKRHYTYDDSIPKYFDQGSVVLTHEWNALNLMIPTGERYFIRCIRRLSSQARDPGLKLQIQGFFGQETMHAHETDRYLKLLENEGFPVGEFQTWHDRLIHRFEKFTLPIVNLAGTAAAEHYTACHAIWLLSNRYCEQFPNAMRDLHQWHAAEELEHKAVAFDLMQELSPRNDVIRYLIRTVGFLGAMTINWLAYRKALRMLLKWEGLSRVRIQEEKKRARKLRIPLFSLSFPGLLSFLKPSFNPHELEDGSLGKKILEEQALRGQA